jgi:Mycothiol maleylpyruvate isomerase N-terminal domain
VQVLADVDLELAAVPGVMEDWSVRDLVFHVAWWTQHGTRALEAATAGRGEEFDYAPSETGAINRGVLDEGRRLSPADALAQEESAFAEFRHAIAALDSATLELRLGNGDTVAQVIAYDGPDHYAEHTAHLRAWFAADED